ncbi:hypothetical protein CPB84DRAFT_1837326 [Gymnopilus junonius]|uniref:RRM domain-containing protein n=1 Tax=Gymnopilus junonius TaxID=109634 RepID=A0A9P5NMC0_GYMJU|nr:hypothetical protein CPB84DRAFT_1837326 [Gymnopilus junonius]
MASFRPGQRKPYARPAARGNAEGQWLHDRAPTGPARGRAPAPAHRAAPVAHVPAGINNKLLVSNLHYEITPKDLIAVFGQIGTLIREPLLRYDRSGRSSGTAIIAFETAMEATRAKKQFDGYLAKGQPMSIAYDTFNPPRAPRAPQRATSAPTTTSLLNRIEKPPLVERISADDTSTTKVPSGPRAFAGGPVRSRPARAAKPPKGPPKGPKKAKTAEELDKELDAFMGDADTVAVDIAVAQDVDMV